MGIVLLLVLAKLVAYSAFCATAPKWFGFKEEDPAFPIHWGAIRLLIGFVAGFGILLVYAGAEERFPVFVAYSLSFIPFRFFEWWILWRLMAIKRNLKPNIKTFQWVTFGVCVSLAFDFVVWGIMGLGFGSFRFFC